MNLKEIKELIDLMNENELAEIEIEKENGKIRLKKNISEEKIQVSKSEGIEKAVTKLEGKEQSNNDEELVAAKEKTAEVVSPMVGVFYRTPAPDAEPFIEEGDEVEEGQILCIIEAMKVMNEIKSEITGKLVKVLVDNATPVEYNQPLFLIEQ